MPRTSSSMRASPPSARRGERGIRHRSGPAASRTVTGKLAELAVTDIVNGDPVRNTSGLADATALRPYEMWAGRSTNDAVGPLFPG